MQCGTSEQAGLIRGAIEQAACTSSSQCWPLFRDTGRLTIRVARPCSNPAFHGSSGESAAIHRTGQSATMAAFAVSRTY